METQINRRNFLKSSALTTGGLVIAFTIPQKMQKALAQAAATPAAPVYPPNAFIQVAPDNSITFVINKLEMGQGVNTSMAQLIAEELDCDWKNVRSVSAPVNPVYNHTMFGTQMTGGSSALSSSWEQHRKIGATARQMLIQAAAEKWQVDPKTCKTEKGFVVHKQKGKISYGEVAEAANKLPMPTDVKLKDQKDFKIIGKSMQRVDAKDKVTGQAIFGLDVRLDGMLYAMVARPPVFGAKLVSVNSKATKEIPGVIDVIKLSNSVAVVAKDTWTAKKAREALEIKWDNLGKDLVSSESILADYKLLAQKEGAIADNRGNIEEGFKNSEKTIEAEFYFPYLAHATMEPMNCTINYDGKKAELWSGHQMPAIDGMTAAKILGLDPKTVEVHTTYAGGSFGRRGNKNSDYVVEACELAKQLKKPVKIVWTREDDMKGGYYRPLTYHKAKIGLDKKGTLKAWKHSIVSQSVVGNSFFEQMMVKNGVDPTAVEGVAQTHYAFDNFKVDLHLPKHDVTTLWWRSVGHTHTGYVMETLVDELALASKKDQLKFRRELLQKSPRHIAVLDLLAKKTPWGQAAAKGRAYGLAIHESFNSVVGQVAEVSIRGGKIKVHKVWSAVHCGQVVNPDGAATQVQSAIIYGLSAALYGDIKIAGGGASNNNFHDYAVARMDEAPQMETFFVKSNDPPTGLGEPGVPPIAPAIANALFKLTGKRQRELPFKV